MNKDLKEKFAFTLGATHVGIFHNIGGTFHKLVESFTHVGIFHNTRRVGFTLAEVLITLGIIGIVSAMTIPTLVKNYQKKVTVTKLQKVHAVLNQIARMAVVDGSIKGYTSGQDVSEEKTKEFFDTFWFQYLKSPKISEDGVSPYKIGMPYKYLNGAKVDIAIKTLYPSGRVFFTTSDGISYWVNIGTTQNFYDEAGNIIDQKWYYISRVMVYADLNGTSEPNVLGKDIFQFKMDFDKGSAYPQGYDKSLTEINNNCKENGSGTMCLAKIMRDDWKFADDYPW